MTTRGEINRYGRSRESFRGTPEQQRAANARRRQIGEVQEFSGYHKVSALGAALTAYFQKLIHRIASITGSIDARLGQLIDKAVSGPSKGTDHAIARWDGTNGDALQDSDWTISDTGGLASSGSQASSFTLDRVTGTVTATIKTRDGSTPQLSLQNLSQTYEIQANSASSNRFEIFDKTNSKTPLVISANTNDNAVFMGAGTVGIFNASPGQALDVTGNIAASGFVEATGLEDADNDTYVRVEESADEDVIRLGTATTERVTVDSGGLDVVSGDVQKNGTALVHALEEWDTTTVTVENTVTETDLYTRSVSAMGANELLRVTVIGRYFNNSGADRTLNISIHLGSTEMWGDTSAAITASAQVYAFRLECIVGNKGATNSQVLGGCTDVGRSGAVDAGVGILYAAASRMAGTFYGTASEDWTSALTFAIKVTHAVADANLWIKAESVLAERINI